MRIFVAKLCWRIEFFFKYLRWGSLEGYPYCCVLQYALGGFLRIEHQAMRRGVVEPDPDALPKYKWVPCRWHQHRHPHWRKF